MNTKYTLPGHIKNKLYQSAMHHRKLEELDNYLISYFKSNNIYDDIEKDFLNDIITTNNAEKLIKKIEEEIFLNKFENITYKDQTHSLSEWSEILHISLPTLVSRYQTNPSNLDFVFKKRQRKDEIKIEHNGEIHTLSEWATIIGIPRNTIYVRYKRNPHDVEYILQSDFMKQHKKAID